MLYPSFAERNLAYSGNFSGRTIAKLVAPFQFQYDYIYKGLPENLSAQILGRLSSPRHYVHTGPVSEVHEIRRVRMVPNLF